MNSNTHWLKSLAVAAITSMAAAHASADVMSAVTAAGNYTWTGTAQIPIPGMVTPLLAHPGGRFVATYSAECAVSAPAGNTTAWVDVDIVVRNAAGAIVATLAPTVGSADAFCSSNGVAFFDGWATQAITGVVALPAGTYRVQVLGRINNLATAGGWMGERSLVVIR